MNVEEVMSVDLVAVQQGDSILEAARRMRDSGVESLPVFDDRSVMGMVTARDIVWKVVSEGLDPKTTPVEAAASVGPIACRFDDSVKTAATIMHERKIHRLLVMDAFDRPVGMISLNDLAPLVRQGVLSGHLLSEVVHSSLPEPRRKAL